MRARIVNETAYPDKEVRAVIEQAMAGWDWPEDTAEWLTITVKRQTRGDARAPEGYTDAKRSSARRNPVKVTIWVPPASQFPQEKTMSYRGHCRRYVLEDWKQHLFRTAAHESWHVWHGAGEVKAEAHATRMARREGIKVLRCPQARKHTPD